jgi:thymidylate synthase
MPEQEDVKLSDAMTKGIAMRKFRAQGVYFSGEDRSDALGAAYQGLTGDTEVHNYQVDGKLEKAFPILLKKVSHPETSEVDTLKSVIRKLNDVNKWKRRNIARFVKSVEDRREIQETPAEPEVCATCGK